MKDKIRYVDGPLDGNTEEVESIDIINEVRVIAGGGKRALYRRDLTEQKSTFRFVGYEDNPER